MIDDHDDVLLDHLIRDTYERDAWQQYRAWLGEVPQAGPVVRSARAAVGGVGKGLAAARDKLDGTRAGALVTSGGDKAREVWESVEVQHAYAAVLRSLQGSYAAAVDASLQTVNPRRALEAYDGVDVAGSVEQLRDLSLRSLDDGRPAVHGRYRAQITASGAATGTLQGFSAVTAAGFVALLAADVVSTIGLSVRGVATHMAHYGYDVTDHTEQAYVMTLMNAAMAESSTERAILIRQARQLAINLSKQKTWAELNKNALTQIAKVGFSTVAERMTKARLLRVLPGISGVLGAGQGYRHGRLVMDTVYYEGRARYLRDKWGGDTIEVIDIDPIAT